VQQVPAFKLLQLCYIKDTLEHSVIMHSSTQSNCCHTLVTDQRANPL